MVSDLGAQGRAATGEGGLLRGLWGPSSRPSSKKCLHQYYKNPGCDGIQYVQYRTKTSADDGIIMIKKQ